jgi:hypothetical protein
LSEVSIRVGRIAREDESEPLIAAAVAASKARWSEWDRVVPLIALREERGVWWGKARNSRQSEVNVAYSTVTGLSLKLAQEL